MFTVRVTGTHLTKIFVLNLLAMKIAVQSDSIGKQAIVKVTNFQIMNKPAH